MILIGMATRRSSLTRTSGCIKAATTTDSRIGFQISIPERGVAFQHLLPNSPTRTTGVLFCEGERTVCNVQKWFDWLGEEAGRLNANAFINVNEVFIANQRQRSKWSCFPLYWNIYSFLCKNKNSSLQLLFMLSPHGDAATHLSHCMMVFHDICSFVINGSLQSHVSRTWCLCSWITVCYSV